MKKRNPSKSIYELAALCGVPIGQACDHAGIARSTPPRWKAGTTPRPHQLAKLRSSILTIAQRNGTLPPSLAPVAGIRTARAPGASALLREVATIIAAAKRIEAMLAGQTKA